jgi:hypothetical protein
VRHGCLRGTSPGTTAGRDEGYAAGIDGQRLEYREGDQARRRSIEPCESTAAALRGFFTAFPARRRVRAIFFPPRFRATRFVALRLVFFLAIDTSLRRIT